jgi:hypothetical protein
VVLPPGRVGPGWQEADDSRSPVAFKVRLFNPQPDHASVGRVHPASAAPGLAKPIILSREKSWTFSVLARRTDIERKGELAMEQREELGVSQSVDDALKRADATAMFSARG